MKALLLNGSPRKGNIHTALESLKKGFSNIDGLSASQIDATKVKVSCCIACEQCGKTKGCVFKDDTNKILDEIIDADILVFATPVYWWGISAQLKVIIDKFYCRQESLKASGKQVGLIITGQLPADDVQYQLISRQIECISDFLGWKLVFCKAYSAYDADDLAKNTDALSEIEQLWKEIR